ncbi:MAG: hypothetical protein ACYC2I_05555 [Elusimicrobiales bacterium]
MKARAAILLCLLAAGPAAAAGPSEGLGAALGEAELRYGGAELVEIEGFTGPDGQIPCTRASYSNSWHYKFRTGSDWYIVNACGPNVVNAARHMPYNSSGEPVRRLPGRFASPTEVLEKLKTDGVFAPAPNPLGDRDVLLRIRFLPAKDGRPEGCYWFASQGRAKALADCAAQTTWKLSAPARSAGGAAGAAAKGKDPAGRYARQAIDAIKAKHPDARLMLVESLVDRTGSAKCIDPKDGWTYVFARPGAGQAISAFAGCRGKTTADYILFDGRNAGDLGKLDQITPPFKDSDWALSQVPADCTKNYSTISMKLKNFKARYAPVTGHSLVWIVDCGSKRYLVDAHTGKYLGPGDKAPLHEGAKHEKTDLGLEKF